MLRWAIKVYLHQPGIEPRASAWKALMLPLHHWCAKLFYAPRTYKLKHIYTKTHQTLPHLYLQLTPPTPYHSHLSTHHYIFKHLLHCVTFTDSNIAKTLADIPSPYIISHLLSNLHRVPFHLHSPSLRWHLLTFLL